MNEDYLYELRRDRLIMSLLCNHLVITPKYRGKLLMSGIAIEVKRIIKKLFEKLDCMIIGMAVNGDHVYIFLRYPPKHSLSFLAKEDKDMRSRRLRDVFPGLKKWCLKEIWTPN